MVRAMCMAGHLQNGYVSASCTFYKALPAAEGTGLVLHMFKFLVKSLVQLENDKKCL